MKSSIVRRGLIGAAALAVAVSPLAASSAAKAASAQGGGDPTLTIRTGGDRGTPASGTANGGVVDNLPRVEYELLNAAGTVIRPECSTFNAANNCQFTGIDNGNYTVEQVRPVNSTAYFLNRRLGVGPVAETAGGPTGVRAVNYNSFPVTVTGNTTFPIGDTRITPDTTAGDTAARTDYWAASRYNPAPPAECATNVALVFDLSASITASFLERYKESAEGYVRALLGKDTNVNLYTFGTTAPAGGTTSTGMPVFEGNTSTESGVAALVAAINKLSLISTPAQFTNWDAGIGQVARSPIHYAEALILTDGDPTAMGLTGTPDSSGSVRTRFRSVEAGIFSANALKAKGTRVIAVGLSPNPGDTENAGSIANLQAISGQRRGTAGTTAPADYFLIPFDDLRSTLEGLALAHCATLSVEKKAEPLVFDQNTHEITYTYTVKNTSPHDGFTIHDVHVQDSLLGRINCTPDVLAPGETATCRATRPVTQAEIDGRCIENTATSNGETPNGNAITSEPPAAAKTCPRQDPAIEVTKVATPPIASPPSYDAPGQTIHYTYTVTNTGNVTLHNVTLTDDRATGIKCTPSMPAKLAPKAVMHCTGSTTTTQTDVNNGSIPNTATATGLSPEDKEVKDEADQKVFAQRRTSIEITKTHTPANFPGAGTTITYTYVITNTGNVPLANLRLKDNKIPSPTSPCTPVDLGGTLAPGQTTTCTASYTTTAADADAGYVKNEAATTGTPPDKLKPPTDEDFNVVPGTGKPAIDVTKEASPQTYDGPDQPITYTYVITNIGALTLTNVHLTDTRIPGPFTCTPTALPGTLTAGDSTTCTATYDTTQADVDAGSILNTATATGTPPSGPDVTEKADEEVTGEQAPAIEITKTAKPQTYDKPGQKITYTYVITNTGNVTLDNVTVTDNRIAGLTCTPSEGSTLAPKAVMHCTATHVITQADVDAGSISNVATAIGHPPTGPEVTDEDDEEVTAGQVAELQVTKSASPTVYSMHGQVITYTYVVSNTGNVTLRNITLDDDVFGRISCPKTTLAPGTSMTCHATHAISAVDLDEGRILNTASATGHPPTGGPVTSPPASALVTAVKVTPPPEVPVTG